MIGENHSQIKASPNSLVYKLPPFLHLKVWVSSNSFLLSTVNCKCAGSSQLLKWPHISKVCLFAKCHKCFFFPSILFSSSQKSSTWSPSESERPIWSLSPATPLSSNLKYLLTNSVGSWFSRPQSLHFHCGRQMIYKNERRRQSQIMHQNQSLSSERDAVYFIAG